MDAKERVKSHLVALLSDEFLGDIGKRLFHQDRFDSLFVEIAHSDRLVEQDVSVARKKVWGKFDRGETIFDQGMYPTAYEIIGSHSDVCYKHNPERRAIIFRKKIDGYLVVEGDRHIDEGEFSESKEEKIADIGALKRGDFDSILEKLSGVVDINLEAPIKEVVIGRMNLEIRRYGFRVLRDEGIFEDSGISSHGFVCYLHAHKPQSWEELLKSEEASRNYARNYVSLTKLALLKSQEVPEDKRWKIVSNQPEGTYGNRVSFHNWVDEEGYLKLCESQFDQEYFTQRIDKALLEHGGIRYRVKKKVQGIF